jgi:hypothetical protein
MSYGKEENTHRQPCRHIPQSSPYTLFLPPLWAGCLALQSSTTSPPMARGQSLHCPQPPARGPLPPRSRCEDHGRHSLPAAGARTTAATASPPLPRVPDAPLPPCPLPTGARTASSWVPLRRRKDGPLPWFPSAGARTCPSPCSPPPTPRSLLPLPPHGCRDIHPIHYLPATARTAGPSPAALALEESTTWAGSSRLPRDK